MKEHLAAAEGPPGHATRISDLGVGQLNSLPDKEPTLRDLLRTFHRRKRSIVRNSVRCIPAIRVRLRLHDPAI